MPILSKKPKRNSRKANRKYYDADDDNIASINDSNWVLSPKRKSWRQCLNAPFQDAESRKAGAFLVSESEFIDSLQKKRPYRRYYAKETQETDF